MNETLLKAKEALENAKMIETIVEDTRSEVEKVEDEQYDNLKYSLESGKITKIDWQEARILNRKMQKMIKAERKKQGMTQKELARKTGFSQGTITRAEKHGWISLDCLLRLAAGLGKTINFN